jgi:uncharacterized protein (TIRG00374 family)
MIQLNPMLNRRSPWTLLFSTLVIGVILVLVVRGWSTLIDAFDLIMTAHPGWLGLGIAAIVLGYWCAGQIYGRVLRFIGYTAPQFWLITAALVSTLISQSIPAGTVGSYAFLTASLRRRGIPGSSVALLASLELLTWMGGMLILFSYGVIYKLLIVSDSLEMERTFPSLIALVVTMAGVTFVATRPRNTLQRWATLSAAIIHRLFRHSLSLIYLEKIIGEIDAHRQLIRERPYQTVLLLLMQVLVFLLQSLALLCILLALGEAPSAWGVIAAYGLTLIFSTFTILPGGGGTVEAALTLALVAGGVSADAALGATLLFRMLNFWLLLPFGAWGYRRLVG